MHVACVSDFFFPFFFGLTLLKTRKDIGPNGISERG